MKEYYKVFTKNHSVRIVETEEKWNVILTQVADYDFYHTYEYHQIAKKDNEQAVLFVYHEDEKIIAIPFVIRPIENTSLYDITSVYGYVGPLSKNIDLNWKNDVLKSELFSFFKEFKIVSVFASLNPFIANQEMILKNMGETQFLGSIVNIDITQPEDVQRQLYSNTTKRYLNKFEHKFSFKTSKSQEDISRFIELYYENMNRVNAASKYFFTEDYFQKFFNAKTFEADLIQAVLKETNEVVSSAIMVRTNKIVQYHISGTLNEYLNITPMRYLIDKMRVLASNMGYYYFNLGGGLNCKKDNLFQFKSSFSKDLKDFKVWKLIVDQTAYNSLSENKKREGNTDTTYFPFYRA